MTIKVPAHILKEVPRLLKTYTCYQVTHFLSQCAEESENFTVTEENLHYSGEGLLKTFPKYFDPDSALQYAFKPEQIANLVYKNRMGNGVAASGDGWKYRGRGYIQLTGKAMYETYARETNRSIDTVVDLVATSEALESAEWFFTHGKIWNAADAGIENVPAVTRRVNGGLTNLQQRIQYFKDFLPQIQTYA
jgi:putative chitinase